MNFRSSNHFLEFSKIGKKRFCSRDGLYVTRVVVGRYPGSLPVGVTRDTWRKRSVPGKNTRETRVALGGFRGNNIRGTRGSLGGFRGNNIRGTRGALGGFWGNNIRGTRGSLGDFRGNNIVGLAVHSEASG